MNMIAGLSYVGDEVEAWVDLLLHVEVLVEGLLAHVEPLDHGLQVGQAVLHAARLDHVGRVDGLLQGFTGEEEGQRERREGDGMGPLFVTHM